jgi:hypothetical protein
MCQTHEDALNPFTSYKVWVCFVEDLEYARLVTLP